jgi:hypothetical protein
LAEQIRATIAINDAPAAATIVAALPPPGVGHSLASADKYSESVSTPGAFRAGLEKLPLQRAASGGQSYFLFEEFHRARHGKACW